MTATDLLHADLTVALFIGGFILACLLAWWGIFQPNRVWRLEDDGPEEIVRIGRGGMGDE